MEHVDNGMDMGTWLQIWKNMSGLIIVLMNLLLAQLVKARRHVGGPRGPILGLKNPEREQLTILNFAWKIPWTV